MFSPREHHKTLPWGFLVLERSPKSAPGKTIPLRRVLISIGSDNNVGVEICIQNQYVAPLHCQIVWNEIQKTAYIQNMLKPNENFTPVSVNGITVSRENSQMLQHNDIIVIGNKAFRFLYKHLCDQNLLHSLLPNIFQSKRKRSSTSTTEAVATKKQKHQQQQHQQQPQQQQPQAIEIKREDISNSSKQTSLSESITTVQTSTLPSVQLSNDSHNLESFSTTSQRTESNNQNIGDNNKIELLVKDTSSNVHILSSNAPLPSLSSPNQFVTNLEQKTSDNTQSAHLQSLVTSKPSPSTQLALQFQEFSETSTNHPTTKTVENITTNETFETSQFFREETKSDNLKQNPTTTTTTTTTSTSTSSTSTSTSIGTVFSTSPTSPSKRIAKYSRRRSSGGVSDRSSDSLYNISDLIVMTSSTSYPHVTSDLRSDLSETNRPSSPDQKRTLSVSWTTTEWSDDFSNINHLPTPSSSSLLNRSSSESLVASSSMEHSTKRQETQYTCQHQRHRHHHQHHHHHHRHQLRRRRSQQQFPSINRTSREHKNKSNRKTKEKQTQLDNENNNTSIQKQTELKTKKQSQSSFENESNLTQSKLNVKDESVPLQKSTTFQCTESLQHKANVSFTSPTSHSSNESYSFIKVDNKLEEECEDIEKSGYVTHSDTDNFLSVADRSLKPEPILTENVENVEAQNNTRQSDSNEQPCPTSDREESKDDDDSEDVSSNDDPQDNKDSDEDYTLGSQPVPKHLPKKTFKTRRQSTKRAREIQSLFSTSNRFNRMWTPSSTKRNRQKSSKIQ